MSRTLTKPSKNSKTPKTMNNGMHNPNARPGYKWTKLGWVPVEWEIMQFGQVMITKPQNGIYKPLSEYSDDGKARIVRIDNFNQGKLDSVKFLKKILLDENDLRRYGLEEGDILINRVNSISHVGKSAIIPFLEEPLVFESNMMKISVNKKICLPKYIIRLLVFPSIIGRLRLKSRTAIAQVSLNQGDICTSLLPIPPLPEQRKIATILSTWDRAIALTRQLIAAKEEQKKGLMQRLLTGKMRVAGFVGEWEECRLGELFDERKETGFVELPLLAITADRGVIYRDELDKKDTSNEDKSKYKRICPGDIGYNTMRMWQGRSAVSNLEGIVSPAYTVIVPKPEVDVGFMGRLFHLPKTILAFWRYSQGLVNDTLNCKFSSFSLVKVYVPCDKEEQVAIGNILKSFDEELELLNRKACALQEQKQGLMQQLLTGKKRVRV